MKIVVIENADALTFEKVEVRKPLTADVLAAEMLVDSKAGMSLILALISICCTFDGKKVAFEDLKKMGGWDFFALLEKISPATAEALAKQLSSSEKKEGSR